MGAMKVDGKGGLTRAQFDQLRVHLAQHIPASGADCDWCDLERRRFDGSQDPRYATLDRLVSAYGRQVWGERI